MSENDPGLTESFWLSLTSSGDLRDLGSEYAEVALDAVLDEGVFKDIPLVGTLIKLGKAGLSIRDRLFAKKVLKFLVAMDRVPDDERKAQIEKLASDPKERQRIGEHLILLLDRLNDMRKPELLARAFQALLEGRIKSVQFHALARVIDLIDPDLIPAFATQRSKGFYHRVEPSAETAHFLQCGLVTIRFGKIDSQSVKSLEQGGNVVPGGVFRESELGHLFYDVMIKTKKPKELGA